MKEETGSPEDLVRSFMDTMIPENSEMYVPPGIPEFNRMKQLASRIMISSGAENLSESSLEASRMGYELIRLTNRKSGAKYYVLREAPGQNRGRGLYIFRAGNGSSGLVIEVPHPLYDLNTDIIGIRAFEKSNARAFLLAGAHRNANRDGSSDAAHSSLSIFQAVHEQVATNSTAVIQIHGFTLINEPGYPQIVLSSVGARGKEFAARLSSILREKNFTTGIANGGNLKELEATENVQGRYARNAGATFIHMELENSIRNKPSKYRNVTAAISEFASNESKNEESDNFSMLVKQELWYYLIPALVMIGSFFILKREKQKSKIS